MTTDIVLAVEDGDGVEFFTVLETGESGMSVSGVARLCGVSHQAVRDELYQAAQQGEGK